MLEVYAIKICLAIQFLLAVVGIFTPKYRENWVQFIGMVVVAVGVLPLARLIDDRGWVSPEAAWIIVGWTVFALGMAGKVWRHRNDPPPSRRFNLRGRHESAHPPR
jgi:predicted membrane channel-forming protein YqfA (hemolysin III family)